MSTPVILAPVANQYFPDSSGRPLSGGFVYTYAAGTSGQIPTYVDAGGIIKNTNPVQLDSGGKASIWLGPQSYKFVVQDANGVQQYVVDDIPGATVQPSISLPEGNALTGAAGSDLIYGSLANHRVAMNNNNGAEDLIVGQNSVDTLTNKTLTAPTINSPTTTGTDAGVEIFRNKTMTAALGANNPTLVDFQGPKSAQTGNATMYTKTIPGGTMGAGKGIRIRVNWTHTTGTASISYQLTYDGTSLGIFSNAGAGEGYWEEEIWNLPGLTNSQVSRHIMIAQNNTPLFIGGHLTLAKDTTTDRVVLLGISAGTDTITPNAWSIELIH